MNYDQYYGTWVEKDGLSISASSEPENARTNEILKKVFTSAGYDRNTYEPTYTLTYVDELGGFVFMCARSIHDSLNPNRASVFVHIFKPAEVTNDAAALVAPSEFAEGTREDTAKRTLAKKEFDPYRNDRQPIVSDDVMAHILHALYFKNGRIIIRLGEQHWERVFRDIIVFLCGLLPPNRRKDISIAASNSYFSGNRPINIITPNVKTPGGSELVLTFDEGQNRLTDTNTELNYSLPELAVCYYFVNLKKTSNGAFEKEADQFLSNPNRETAVYGLIGGHIEGAEAQIAAPSRALLSKIPPSDRIYMFKICVKKNGCPYSDDIYAAILGWLFDGYDPNQSIDEVYRIPAPKGFRREKFCADRLEKMPPESAKKRLQEISDRDAARANAIAKHIVNKDILLDMPDGLPTAQMLDWCGEPRCRLCREPEEAAAVLSEAIIHNVPLDSSAVIQAVNGLKNTQPDRYDALRIAVFEKAEQALANRDSFNGLIDFAHLLYRAFDWNDFDHIADVLYHDVDNENVEPYVEELKSLDKDLYRNVQEKVSEKIEFHLENADYTSEDSFSSIVRDCRLLLAFGTQADEIWQTLVNIIQSCHNVNRSLMERLGLFLKIDGETVRRTLGTDQSAAYDEADEKKKRTPDFGAEFFDYFRLIEDDENGDEADHDIEAKKNGSFPSKDGISSFVEPNRLHSRENDASSPFGQGDVPSDPVSSVKEEEDNPPQKKENTVVNIIKRFFAELKKIKDLLMEIWPGFYRLLRGLCPVLLIFAGTALFGLFWKDGTELFNFSSAMVGAEIFTMLYAVPPLFLSKDGKVNTNIKLACGTGFALAAFSLMLWLIGC